MRNVFWGCSILAGFTVVFAVMKLTGVIDWGWLWVFSPLWGPWAVALLISLALTVFAIIERALSELRGDKGG